MFRRKVIVDPDLLGRIERYVDKIYPSKDALSSFLSSGKRLRIYLGVDPTGPHLHLGHLTNLLALKELQKLGHEIIFLVGDFTAKIGDPTGKADARKPLGDKEIAANLKTYKKQASRVVSFSGRGAARLEFNSRWLKKLTLADWQKLSSHFTVQQMVERDMFEKRVKEGRAVGLHEFGYPLMQGYDSVALDVDAEIGGTDQTFNMLIGRQLMKIYKNKEKFVIATRLLINPDTGKKLMSKSEGGTINLDDPPRELFGKIMAVDDAAMFEIAKLCTDMDLRDIGKMEKEVRSGTLSPKTAKQEIARAVVAVVCGAEEAGEAQKSFEMLFSLGKAPENLNELTIRKETNLLDFVVASGAVKSRSEARRLIEQGGVEIDGSRKKNPAEILAIRGGEIARVGKKRFFRLKI